MSYQRWLGLGLGVLYFHFTLPNANRYTNTSDKNDSTGIRISNLGKQYQIIRMKLDNLIFFHFLEIFFLAFILLQWILSSVVANSRLHLLPETRFITRYHGATLIGYYFERQSYLGTWYSQDLGHAIFSIFWLILVISLERNNDSLNSRGKYTSAV